MTQIAADAGTTPSNLYRYFPSKKALFDTMVPADAAARHDQLVDTRIAALTGAAPDPTAATALLEFWLDYRLPLVVLPDRGRHPVRRLPAAFVRRLVQHLEQSVERPATPAQREVLELVFDNTRRALAVILRTAQDRQHARELSRDSGATRSPDSPDSGRTSDAAGLTAASADGVE